MIQQNKYLKSMLLISNQKEFKKLCEKCDLNLVILHGSYVSGNVNKESDIDVAFLVNKEKARNCYLELIAEFSSFFGDKFDPVLLNGAEAMISRQVVLNGVVLYERKESLFNEFKVSTISRYQDAVKFRLLEKNICSIL